MSTSCGIGLRVALPLAGMELGCDNANTSCGIGLRVAHPLAGMEFGLRQRDTTPEAYESHE